VAWSQERRVILPLVGLVVLSVVVLTSVMFGSSFHLEALRERSVLEATHSLANERSDRLDKRVIEQDNAVASLTEGDALDTFGSRWLEVASVQSPTVRAVLAVDLTGPSRDVLAFASRSPGPTDDEIRRLLLGTIWPELDLSPGNELRHLHTSRAEKSYLISHWQRDRGERKILVLAYHDVPRIIHDLFPSLYAEDAAEPSRVNVVDGKGRIVFGPPLSRGSLTVGRRFETTLYKWQLNVSMVAAEELGRAVERRRILEMGLVALASLVVIAGIVVIMIAALRERKLAMAKSEFVANVSHELKTPLALVRMFSELLLSGRAPPEKSRQYLEIVVAESERLSALIDNVLDFARVERGESFYEFREANLLETAARAVEVQRGRAERQSVQLTVEVDPRSLPASTLVAYIDERAVEIAVINLIDNALKYASGTSLVRIVVLEEAKRFVVSVVDQGPGIAEAERRRIFERFVRGSTRTEGEAVRGSGIGLSLVLQIAEAHGGTAWVDLGDGPPDRPGAAFRFAIQKRPLLRPSA
jgi:two-component system, OmpR family, phosphate regulon sensor histidine kinase PhoR